MTRLTNTPQRYGAVAIALHWLMAMLLMALLVLGLYMVGLPDAGFDTRKIVLILYHKELGLLALVLVAVRLVWRLGNVLPSLAETLPEWRKVVARFVHLCLYGLMCALPITGWLMSSAAGIPVSLFGWVDLPDAIGPDEALFQAFIRIHKWLADAMLLCIVLHAGAALRHHFLLKDKTLDKMWPGGHV